MKNELTSKLGIRIQVHAFEDENNNRLAALYGTFNMGKNIVGRFDYNVSTNFPLSTTSNTFQIILLDSNTNSCLGSLTIPLNEVYNLPSQLGKHWVTLFDDLDDDVYDGDYIEDDVEVPRALIEYQIFDMKQCVREYSSEDKIVYETPNKSDKVNLSQNESERNTEIYHKIERISNMEENIKVNNKHEKSEEVIIEPEVVSEESKKSTRKIIKHIEEKTTTIRYEDSQSKPLFDDLVNMSDVFSHEGEDSEKSRATFKTINEPNMKLIKESTVRSEKSENGVNIVKEYKSYVKEFNNDEKNDKKDCVVIAPEEVSKNDTKTEQKINYHTTNKEELKHTIEPEVKYKTNINIDPQLNEKEIIITENLESQPPIAESCKDESNKNYEDQIEKLLEENKRLRKELEDIESSNKDLNNKYQTEIKNYDERISNFIKEKYDFQQRISSLENDLEDTNRKMKNAIDELRDFKEKSKRELEAKDAEINVKIQSYQNSVSELKITTETTKKTNIERLNMQEYIDKLIELEKKYLDQLKDVQVKLLESENKRTEMSSELRMKNESEEALKAKIVKLNEENRTLKDTNNHLQNSLKDSQTKMAELEKKLIEIEQKSNTELVSLHEKNIELTSLVEQLKAMLEEAKHNNANYETIIETKNTEIKELRSLNEQLKERMKNQNDLLRNELNAKSKLWDEQRKTMQNSIDQNKSEADTLRSKLREAQNELLKKGSLEDELKEKMKMIDSLESIINDYKKSTETLKKRIAELEEELEKAKKEAKEMKERCKELQKRITIYEERIKKITIEYNIITNTLEKKENDSKHNEAKYKEYQSEINGLKEKLKKKDAKIDNLEKEQKKWTERLDEMAEKAKEIEDWRSKSKNKDDKLQEISVKLLQQNKLSREFENELNKIKDELNICKGELNNTNCENEELKRELAQRNKEIENLTNILANCKQESDSEDSKSGQPVYTSDKSDKVDQMFALYINAVHCPVKLKKIGDGQYIFGTKKIFAKIQNEKLVIRVGGGYMMIEDFLTTYTAQELNKMKRNEANEAEAELNSTMSHKTMTNYGKGFGKEGIPEANIDHNTERLPTTGSRKKSEHIVFTKSTSKVMGDKAKNAPNIANRSKSPAIGLINGTNRTRILTEQDLSNAKTTKLTVDKMEGKVMTKKFVPGETNWEESENDFNLTSK